MNDRTGRERQLTFAEIELEELPDQQATGPISKVVAPESESLERKLDFGQEFRYVSREQQFVQQAREMEWKSVDSAEFISFQTYWPTYDQMQPRQLQWYLYWRQEVRSGRYPDTDLSYLFVYLYELIHGIGWTTPQQGYELMDQVWRAYRTRYPKLDMYVREWMYDLATVSGLDQPPAEPLYKLPRNLSPVLKELEWRRRFTAEPLDLTWEMLLHLIDYDVEKSRYYKDQGRKELRSYFPKIVVLVDGYLAKTKGFRLLELVMPNMKKVTRVLFRSAVYAHELYGHAVTVSVLPISEHPPLRAYLTQLIRYTENKLRELTGFKGKLKGISLEPDVEQLISRFLQKEFDQRQAEEAKARIPAVMINTAKLRKLQQESDEVRDMLLNEEPIAESMSNVPRDKHGSAVPKQAELDFERGWQAFEGELPEMKSETVETAEQHSESEETMLPVQHEGSDMDSSAAFSDDVSGKETKNSGLLCVETNNADPVGIELSHEWRELSAQLSRTHKEMLAALLEGEAPAVRYGIAEQVGSMPELLMDEINEISMEWLGDLLIDGDEITEEYRAMLHDLLDSVTTSD